MESNIDNPFAFFEYITSSEDNIVEIIDLRLLGDPHELKLPDKIIFPDYDEGEYIEQEMSLMLFLSSILRYEFNKSKSLLLKNFSKKEGSESKKVFCIDSFVKIQSIINDNYLTINKYLYMMQPLRELVDYINRMFIPQIGTTLDEFKLDEKEIQSNQEINFTNKDIMYSVLSYMQGYNERKEIILSLEDFQLLIQYTSHLIDNEEIPPNIEKQLEPKLTNDTIRFSFWVLHKELYTTKRIREYFYDFIKAVFVKFKDNEISSIKSQFGTRNRVFDHDFLPEIISKYLSK